MIARRKRWRLVKVAGAAVVGAIIGWMLFAMIDSGQAALDLGAVFDAHRQQGDTGRHITTPYPQVSR